MKFVQALYDVERDAAGHDPHAHRRDVLERLPLQPATQIEELLPHR